VARARTRKARAAIAAEARAKRAAAPSCPVHGYELDSYGLCWGCCLERDRRDEEDEARRDREYYRATAPVEVAIAVVDGGTVQRFRAPNLRRRRA
jgi:hypothetical protein